MTAEHTSPPEERAGTTDSLASVGLAYATIRWVIMPLAKLLYRPRIEGRRNVPRSGPVIPSGGGGSLDPVPEDGRRWRGHGAVQRIHSGAGLLRPRVVLGLAQRLF